MTVLYSDVKEELTVPSEATGAAAFERTLLLVMLQQLRSSPLRFLHVDENSGEAANPAVLIVRNRRAPRLGAAQQTQDGYKAPCGVHGAQFKSNHFNSSSGADMSRALMGMICGCSGLTGGQYLSECVTATHLEEVETFTVRGTFQVKIKSFNSTLRVVNGIRFYFCKNAACVLQGRSPESEVPKLTISPNSCKRDDQNKPFANKL